MKLLENLLLILVLVVTVECGGSHSSCAFHARTKRSKYSEPLNRSRRDVECVSGNKYRTIDGTCNNLQNPTWGATDSKLQRGLSPVYSDDIGKPRVAYSDGTALPHPRTISNTVHFERSFISRRSTAMVMQWGQFIDHDLTGTAVVTNADGSDIDCCARTDSAETEYINFRKLF